MMPDGSYGTAAESAADGGVNARSSAGSTAPRGRSDSSEERAIVEVIEEAEMEDGSLRLSLPDRGRQVSRASAKEVASQPSATRIITVAWGERYIHDLLSVTIPALMSPGNIPAFVEHFETEFVIVTETRLFDRVALDPAISRLVRYCDVRLVPIDDILSPWYGMTLTHALTRGFADLGDRMVDANLIFLNADFIVADGSYRHLAERIRRGERLVVSPSYCAVYEEMADRLRARRDPMTGAIAVPPREMAAMVLAHRHNTVRAKTINQSLFRIGRYDQFYWYVNEKTMLCRQMPIAVVYMRPERTVPGVRAYWDYGVISEYCPAIRPCVLGDSDQFLMAELRAGNTFQEQLHLGWPSTEEIASDLSFFTTKDQREYGRYDLVLHSADMPPEVDAERRNFAEFVDAIYRRLAPSPTSHLAHRYFTEVLPQFTSMHAERRLQRQTAEAARAARRAAPGYAERKRRIDGLRAQLRVVALESDAAAAAAAAATHLPADGTEKAVVAAQKARLSTDAPSSAQAKLYALRVKMENLHRQLAELEGCDARGDESVSIPTESAKRDGAAAVDGKESGERVPTLQASLLAWAARVYDVAFGRLPRLTRWHPYYTMLRQANAVVAACGKKTDLLIVASSGTLASILFRGVGARKTVITPEMANDEFYATLLEGAGQLDMCVCDLAMGDLFECRRIFEVSRPYLRHGGKFILFYFNMRGINLDVFTFEFTKKVFPLAGRSSIRFTGSLLGGLAVRLYTRMLTRHGARPLPVAVLGTLMLALAPLSRVASALEARRASPGIPSRCTSIVMEIELD